MVYSDMLGKRETLKVSSFCATVSKKIQLSISPQSAVHSLAGDGSLGHPHSFLILSLHPHLTLQSLHVSTPTPALISFWHLLSWSTPAPFVHPLFSASALSAINLLSSHLTVYEWFVSHQFTTPQTRTDNTAMMERFSIICYHQLVLHSEVANYLDAKLNLVPALWLLLLLS